MQLTNIVSRETCGNYGLFLVFLLVFFSACSEEAVKIDVLDFNKSLENAKEVNTAKDVMRLYFNSLPGEKDTNYSVTEEQLSDGNYRITLIRTRLKDDSAEGEKFVMIAEMIGSTWKVVSLEKNWRCYKGRGHTGWGIDPCG